MCKNIVDRLVDPPLDVDPRRKSLWIHAAGGLAIERASEIALNLCHRIYPNLLTMFIYTDTLDFDEEVSYLSQPYPAEICARGHY